MPEESVAATVCRNRSKPAWHGAIVVGHRRGHRTFGKGSGREKAGGGIKKEAAQYVVLPPEVRAGAVHIAVEIDRTAMDVTGSLP